MQPNTVTDANLLPRFRNRIAEPHDLNEKRISNQESNNTTKLNHALDDLKKNRYFTENESNKRNVPRIKELK